MKAIFVGVKKPYTSTKNGQTYFRSVFVLPVRDAPNCVELLEADCSASHHSALLGVQTGTPVDIDLMPRMFAGKPQGMELVAING